MSLDCDLYKDFLAFIFFLFSWERNIRGGWSRTYALLPSGMRIWWYLLPWRIDPVMEKALGVFHNVYSSPYPASTRRASFLSLHSGNLVKFMEIKTMKLWYLLTLPRIARPHNKGELLEAECGLVLDWETLKVHTQLPATHQITI